MYDTLPLPIDNTVVIVAISMKASKRSKSGCWTCRLRRKKCSEGGPPCQNCSTMGIHCHGYGPRPAWKDRGEREQDEARKLKLQMPRRARSYSIASTIYGTAEQGDLYPNVDGNEPVEDVSWPPSLTDSDIFSGGDTTTDAWSPSFAEDFVSTPQHDVFPDLSTFIETSDPLDSPFSSISSGTCSVSPPTAISWPTSSTGFGDVTSLLEDPQSFRLFPTSEGSMPEVADTTVSVSNPINPSHPLAFFRLVSDAGEQFPKVERELELLMRFITETCGCQSKKQNVWNDMARMSWLLLLLTRSPTFYHASISMSAYERYMHLSSDGDTRSSAMRDYQEHRAQALSQFHGTLEGHMPLPSSSSGRLHLSSPAEKIICGLHLAKLEVRLASIH